MHAYVGGQRATSADDFLELALGTPLALWLGEEGESAEEQAARQDGARDILADFPDLPDRAVRIAAEAIERHAPQLFNVIPLPRPTGRRRNSRKGAAA